MSFLFPRQLPFAALTLLASVTSSPAIADVIDIDVEALARLVDDGVTVIDIRRPDEWTSTGVVEGSHLLTFFDETGAYDAAAWKAELDGLVDANEPVVLICRTGRRTSIVSEWLSEEVGHETVYNVSGGIVSWRTAGGDVVAP